MNKKAEALKFDQNKPDMSLIPVAALLDEAGLWTKGKTKYAAFNWHNGLMYRRILSAIGRHLALLNAGIDMDTETKHHHASAIRCGCAMLVQFTLEGRVELDDRMKLSPEVTVKIEAMSQGEMVWDILLDQTQKSAS